MSLLLRIRCCCGAGGDPPPVDCTACGGCEYHPAHGITITLPTLTSNLSDADDMVAKHNAVDQTDFALVAFGAGGIAWEAFSEPFTTALHGTRRWRFIVPICGEYNGYFSGGIVALWQEFDGTNWIDAEPNGYFIDISMTQDCDGATWTSGEIVPGSGEDDGMGGGIDYWTLADAGSPLTITGNEACLACGACKFGSTTASVPRPTLTTYAGSDPVVPSAVTAFNALPASIVGTFAGVDGATAIWTHSDTFTVSGTTYRLRTIFTVDCLGTPPTMNVTTDIQYLSGSDWLLYEWETDISHILFSTGGPETVACETYSTSQYFDGVDWVNERDADDWDNEGSFSWTETIDVQPA